jgi:hypothetical protein
MNDAVKSMPVPNNICGKCYGKGMIQIVIYLQTSSRAQQEFCICPNCKGLGIILNG